MIKYESFIKYLRFSRGLSGYGVGQSRGCRGQRPTLHELQLTLVSRDLYAIVDHHCNVTFNVCVYHERLHGYVRSAVPEIANLCSRAFAPEPSRNKSGLIFPPMEKDVTPSASGWCVFVSM